MRVRHQLAVAGEAGERLLLPARRVGVDATSWEAEPLAGLAKDGELMAFVHTGFWQPMDTLRERNLLEELWQSGRAPWKRW